MCIGWGKNMCTGKGMGVGRGTGSGMVKEI